MSAKILQPPELAIDQYMAMRFGTVVRPEGRLERRIVWNLLAHLKRVGFRPLSVFDGDENTRARSAKAAMELIFNLDDAWVWVGKGRENKHPIRLVLGNGIDVLCDWRYYTGDPDGFNAAMDAFDSEAYA